MNHQHTFIEIEGSDSATPSIFTCSRCKEPGTKRCICENRYCNYIIHTQCLKDGKAIHHPFFKNSHFELYDKAAEGVFCDACGKDLLGAVYWCSKTNYALHPCCLKLEDKLYQYLPDVAVKLCHEVPLDCFLCKQRYVVRNQFQGWSYVFDYSDDSDRKCVHVSCWNYLMLALKVSEKNRSKGSMRSFMKFTGKLALGIFQASVGDFSSIITIGEAIFTNFK